MAIVLIPSHTMLDLLNQLIHQEMVTSHGIVFEGINVHVTLSRHQAISNPHVIWQLWVPLPRQNACCVFNLAMLPLIVKHWCRVTRLVNCATLQGITATYIGGNTEVYSQGLWLSWQKFTFKPQGVTLSHAELLHKGLMVANCAVTCTRDRLMLLRVLNPGKETVYFHKGMILTTFQLCDNSVGIVRIPASNISCSYVAKACSEIKTILSDSEPYVQS